MPDAAVVATRVAKTKGPSGPLKTSRFKVPGEGKSATISVVTIGSLLVLWFIVTQLGLIKPLFLPSPQAVFEQFMLYLTGEANDKPLWQHFAASMFRVFSAFALACLTAIPVGIAMGMSRWARGIFDPPIEFYRPLPPLAYLPLIIIWFGIDELPKVLLIYLACFAPLALAARSGMSRWARGIFDPPIEFYRPLPPLAYLPLIIIWFGIDELPKVLLIYLACFAPLALAARSGMKSASQEQINAAYSMGASYGQIIWHVVLPSALPEVLVGMRIAIGFGWTTLVAAEMVAASTGLGQMVLNASNFLRTDIVIMGIFVIGIVAYLFDLLMRWVERKAVPWKGRM